MLSWSKPATILMFAVLIVLCGYQWRSLRLMKSEIAKLSDPTTIATLAAERQFTPERLDEVERTLVWLDEYYGSAEGLRRAHGLCFNGKLDSTGPAVWIFGQYLRRRMDGTPEGKARQEVLDAIRQSDEWRGVHAASH